MSNITINGRVYPSIWKTTKTDTDNKGSSQNNNQARHRQAYRDPTAKAAIDNILNEERKSNKKKRQAQNRKRHD